jgi:TonB-linked SusC/RagA family outer membrane protein
MKKVLLLFAFASGLSYSTFAQSRTVKGQVRDEKGEPVIGATVRVKGGLMETFTDENGMYEILVDDGKDQLEIENISMETVVVSIGADGQPVNVTLKPGTNELEGVQVYGKKIDRRSYVGALTTVSADQISKRPVTNIAKAIEGAAPGVQVTSGGGQPGASPDILIRGLGSIGASSAPLIVLDGAPYSGTLASINPLDIESMTFLKDATATALYGSRGANGVILLTTKRGGNTSGRPKISLDASVGTLNRFIPRYETLGAKDYYEVAYQAWTREPGIPPPSRQDERSSAFVEFLGGYNAYDVPNDQLIQIIDGKGRVNPNASLVYTDDWEEEIMQTGIRQAYSLSIANGDDRSDYFLSVGYNSDKGIVKNSQYDRFTARLNVNSKITDWLKAGINLAGTLDDQRVFVTDNAAYINPFMSTQTIGPIYPVYRYDSLGNRMYEADGVTPLYDFGRNDANNPAKTAQFRPFGVGTNAVAAMQQDDRSTDILTTFGKAYLEARILKDITVTTNFVLNNLRVNNDQYQNFKYGDAASFGGRINRQNNNITTWTFNQIINWKPKFGVFAADKHHLDVTLVHEAYTENLRYNIFRRTGLVGPGFLEGAAAANNEGSNSYEDNLAIESYIGSISYDYMNKYYFTVNVNRNGTSRFSPKARWGTFYSVGAGWIISDESFLSSTKSWLEMLKLRASYGYTGQQDLGAGYYPWMPRYDFNHNNIYPGYTVLTIGNEDLKWERRLEMNVGFDVVFKGGRYSLSLDYFNRGSRDMLYGMPLVPSRGIASQPVNVGDMNNSGIEAIISVDVVRARTSNDFNWNVRANLTHIRNKIVSVQGKDSVINGATALIKGLPAYSFFMPRYAGVDDQGMALYYTGNGDETTNDYNTLGVESYSYVGSPFRDLEGSLTNTFSYKGFDLTFMVSFGIGGKFYDNTYASLMAQGYMQKGNAWHVDMLNAWNGGEANSSKDAVPRASFTDRYATAISDRFLVSSSFLNLKSINLGYTIPAKFAKKAQMSQARIYVSMDNVFYLSPRKGLDLNQSFFGASSFSYFPYRTVMFGIQLGL